MKYAYAFLMACVLDVCYMLYTQAAAERKRLKAGFFTAMIGLMSSLYYNSIRDDYLLIAFWCSGLFLGTYYANEIERWCMKSKMLSRLASKPPTPAE